MVSGLDQSKTILTLLKVSDFMVSGLLCSENVVAWWTLHHFFTAPSKSINLWEGFTKSKDAFFALLNSHWQLITTSAIIGSRGRRTSLSIYQIVAAIWLSHGDSSTVLCLSLSLVLTKLALHLLILPLSFLVFSRLPGSFGIDHPKWRLFYLNLITYFGAFSKQSCREIGLTCRDNLARSMGFRFGPVVGALPVGRLTQIL